ncbi:alpha-galactosidase [Paenibacillus riograndensis]|uniref:Alpha-galactosidase n=1 Tax=Paenibacillus riograndensis TaxID=483937 RepID=A0A132TW18_9BACL|nr:alpha-galactosidase [Paenibacillus riograndensis]KWX75472.1 alpha-galactosidase [Paenibacillus riograndensis]
MSIIYDAEQQIFHLQTTNTSYVFGLARGSYPVHLHWGRKIRGSALSDLYGPGAMGFSSTVDPKEPAFSLDTLPQEYPGYGSGDFREPAYEAELLNGTSVTELTYVTHSILKGKPALEGLPAVYAESGDEAETLQLVLEDATAGLRAELSYTVISGFDAVIRSARLTNTGSGPLKLNRALSVALDFPHANYELIQLSGSWARERHLVRAPLHNGRQGIDSKRGASSHQQNPFLALLAPQTVEDSGEAYGFSLVYSGSFSANADVDQYGTTRVTMGINPFGFRWLLAPGESFQTPEAVLVYSDQGIGGMSRIYHRLYRTRLARGLYRDEPRPVLINNWEATYFNFDADKIEDIARAGKALGIELFVLDDGWFGRRDDDTTSLGDWFVDTRKLPQGLPDLVERVRRLGMQFGLWFEPEMVSPDSELYRAHPDWCLHVPDRRRSQARNQLILDLSRPEVCDYIIDSVSSVLASAPITYVKWDMNRHMTEIGSAALPPERQGETAHRYMLGLYRVMEEITSKFPHVLFESCSGGGGRFDPGILHYMPQTWTSDDTDAVERLKIQYGTSIVYPASSMGSHISAVPNHQVHRSTSLSMRGDVAMSGNFGYELDLTLFTPEEQAEAAAQVAFYKDIRSLVQQGDMYRLLSPFEGNETAWMFVDADRSEALAGYFRVLAGPNMSRPRLRLQGLDPEKDYVLKETGAVYGGDRLMYAGLLLQELHGDFQSKLLHFVAVDKA